jgi:hypothetical protein
VYRGTGEYSYRVSPNVEKAVLRPLWLNEVTTFYAIDTNFVLRGSSEDGDGILSLFML